MLSRFSLDAFTIFARVIVLLTMLPIHEWAHGFVAWRLGDDTPRRQGRLTLNPFAHLDLMGSILLVLCGFGWAKPVQVDNRSFKNPKRDMALTALAGPMSNIIMAGLVMAAYKLVLVALYTTPRLRFIPMNAGIESVVSVMIMVNLYLAVFNLLPVPPLDGSKIFAAFLPDRFYYFMMSNARQVTLVLFILIFTGLLGIPLSYLAGLLLRLLNWITQPIMWLL